MKSKGRVRAVLVDELYAFYEFDVSFSIKSDIEPVSRKNVSFSMLTDNRGLFGVLISNSTKPNTVFCDKSVFKNIYIYIYVV